jgi:hypothetical protein
MIRFKFFVALSLGMISLGRSAVLQTPTLENPVNVAPRASITASSVYEDDYRFQANRVADGSIADNYGAPGNYWLAKGVNDSMPGTLPAWLRFDLSSVYDISSVSVLNTLNQQYVDSGTKDFNIQLSLDGTNYSSPVFSGRLDWQNDTFQNFYFPSILSARYVQFNLTSAYVNVRDAQRVGLNEVKIIAVPEPSSLSLMVLGGVVMALKRRK